MDVVNFVRQGGELVVNPNYTKTNGQPKYIHSVDVAPDVASNAFKTVGSTSMAFKDPLEAAVMNYGIMPSRLESERGSYQQILAESQSNWKKAGSAIVQTLGDEILLGTLKAFSDIADYAINFFNPDNDYTNPISKMLGDWQESIRNDIAPIYTDPNVDILHGGLTDFGWYASNFPSIASSLTLLIPGRAVAGGISKGFNMINRLGGKGINNSYTRKLVRRLSKADKVSDPKDLTDFQRALNSNRAITLANTAAKDLTTAYVMRVAENYQEASQTYADMNEQAMAKFKEMDDDKFNEWKNQHKDFVEENGLQNADRKEIAAKLANVSANRTFQIDKINFISDFAQLWGLRDAGKLYKKVKSANVLKDNKKAIASIGKSSEELAEMAAKANKFKQYGSILTTAAKGSGLTFLTESSEGLEEMINYVAQQEGINYGKTILGTKGPSTLSSRLNDYMQNAELWESAFWGLLGGVVFQGLGSKYNLYQKQRAANKRKEQEKENPDTKETINANPISWFEAEEKPEVEAARATISKQNQKLEDAVNKINQIDKENINIFGEPDKITHELPKFEGSDEKIELDKQKAKASVIDQWLADSTVDAVHSGTFDELTEFLSSKEMQQYMTSLNQTSAEDSASYVNALVNRATEIKREYVKQLDFMENQATYSNLKNNNKASTTIPTQYVVMAARQNLDRILTNKTIDKHISILEANAAEILDTVPAEDLGLSSEIDYENAIALGTLSAKYQRNAAEIKALEKDTESSPLEKMIKLDELNKHQDLILKELQQLQFTNAANTSPIGRVLYTLRAADTAILNENNEVIADINAVAKTDKELLEQIGFSVGEDTANMAGVQADNYGQLLLDSKKLIDLANKEVKENDNELKKLKEVSISLYDRYSDIANLKVLKTLNSSNIIKDNTDFENAVDIMHNRLNEARRQVIAENENKIMDIYDKYKNTNKAVVPNIIALYLDGRKESAAKIAEENLDKDSAKTIIDALDIFNFNSDNNIHLANQLWRAIDAINYYDYLKSVNGVKDEELSDVDESAKQEQLEDEEQKQEDEEIKPEKQKPLTKREKRKARREAKQRKRQEQKAREEANKEKKKGKQQDSSTGEQEQLVKTDTESEDVEEVKEIEEETPKEQEQLQEQKEEVIDNEPLPIDEFVTEMNDLIKDNLSKVYYENENATEPVDDSERIRNVVDTEYLLPKLKNKEITNEQYAELVKIRDTNIAKGMKVMNDFLTSKNKAQTDLQDAAANVARMSKIGIGKGEMLPDIFRVGIENFINAYVEASLSPMIDGKKVLDVKEIAYVVKNSLPDTDESIVGFMLEKVNQYLQLPTNRDSYYLVNKQLLTDSDGFVNQTKDDSAIKEETTKLRVNIADYITFYSSDEQSTEEDAKKYFDVLNSFRTGDVIDAIVEENVIFFQKDGVVIGSVSKASYINGIYRQGNKGFVEDVTLDANGRPISNALDIYKDLFTSDKASQSEVRGLILRASSEGFTKEIIEAFKNSKWLKAVKEKHPELLVNKGDKIDHYGKAMLEHLAKIYNYNMQGISYKDKATKKQAIIDNLNNYFNSLFYNYDALNRINKDTKFKISYINDGQIIKKVENIDNNDNDQHLSLPFPKDVIVDRANSRIGFIQKTQSNVVHISGKPNVQDRGSKDTHANLTVFDRNGAPTFVHASYLDERDLKHAARFNDILVNLQVGIKNHINKIINNDISEGVSSLDKFSELIEVFSNILYSNNATEDKITLLRGKQGVRVEMNIADKSKNRYGYDGIDILIYRKGAMISSINITKNPKTNAISYKIENENTEVVKDYISHGYIKDINRPNKQTDKARFSIIESEQDASNFANMILSTFLSCSQTEISVNAIKDDNLVGVNRRGPIIERKNGKIITHFGYETKEYDSYNDFIIDNDLIRVNMDKNPRTGNRVPRGPKQSLNQVMYIDATTPLSSPVEDIDEQDYTPEVPEGSTSDSINLAIFDTFSKGEVSGEQLFISAYGQEAYNDFVNAVGTYNILESILPRFIKYHPRLNYEKNGNIVGPEAVSNVGSKDAFVKVQSATDKDKRTNVRLKSGHVLIGDVTISKLASLNGLDRKRGVAILIHEQVHNLIATNPNYTKKQILDALRPIYNEFVTGVDALDKNSDLFKFGDSLRTKLDKAYNNAKYSDDSRLLEEFLVETITNSKMIAVMNAIKVSDSTTSKEDNLFSKLIRFMAKWLLGVDVNKGSLLEKEVNVLNDLIDDKSKKREDIQTTTEKVKTDIGTTKNIITKIKLNLGNNNIEDDDDEDRYSTIGVNTNNESSLDGHLSALPLSEKAQFGALIERGAISYVCKV